VFPSSFPLLRQGANPDEGSAKPAEGDTELDMLVDVRPRDLLTSLHNSGHLDGLRKDLLNEFIYSDLGKEFKLFVDSIVRARVGAGQKTGLEASVVSSVEQGWGSVPGLKENVERWIRETAGTRVKGVVDKIAEDRIAEDRIKDGGLIVFDGRILQAVVDGASTHSRKSPRTTSTKRTPGRGGRERGDRG